MNRVVVLRAAAGLAAYLKDHGASTGKRRADDRGRDSVVIGYDARHNSDVFARDTAEVMTGAGFKAYVLPRPLPTPLLAFAIRDLGCVAGVMVTASHNPPQDNGYKVYLGDGSQIVPPADAEIAEQIAAVGPVADIPRPESGSGQEADIEVVGDEILDRYLRTVVDLAGGGPRDLKIVYTPLHGVGGTTVATALKLAGFDEPHVATAQAEPDPDFPTVSFPNPEEPGAMDLALALAEEVDADIVVANDPDADRCAVALPGPHGWQMLRGDEVGALLAQHLLELRREGVYATSIVSSSLLGKMAVAEKQLYAETLTGFKWIGRVREPRVRLRGGARLLRRPRPREGQGRRLRAGDGVRHRGPGEGRRTHAARPARRHRPHLRAARDRPAVGADGRPRGDPGRGRPAARPAPDLARWPGGRRGRRPLAGLEARAAHRSVSDSGWPTTAG